MFDIYVSLTYSQLYIIFISTLSFLLFGYDKWQALKPSKNVSRISENILFFSALIGGTFGALLSMFIFRHKIKKLSFILKFSIIVLIQIVVIYFYLNLI